MVLLKSQQTALQKALASKHAELVLAYVGALTVLADETNPDRVALAAHGIRELMGKLPAYVDVAMPAHTEKLGDRIRPLEEAWKRATERSGCRQADGTWSGPIDQHLGGALRQIDRLFEWLQDNMPRRRAEIEQTLLRLDPSGGRLPAPLQSLNVDQWMKMRDFFIAVAHHGQKCSCEELAPWVDALERFLIDRLIPRTFDEQDAIDSILAASEGGSDD